MECKRLKIFSLLLLLILKSVATNAQTSPPDLYPQGYFRNPLKIPISLAGNFGELRPNHFHMGLDIRTTNRVNLPVYAAAEGMISQVKVEPGGFGQAIYITHPNGYTTVYGHLNAFFPALAAWVKQQQYRLQSWKLTLVVPPGKFPVKKGDFIALSGNTGGSQAPHLHFEIRRTKDDVNLNPLLFGFDIPDHTAPELLKLAVYDLSKSIYEQKPFLFPVKKTEGNRQLSVGSISVPFAKAGFAISTFDTQSGSSNRNGIYEATLFDNEHAVIAFRMNEVSYGNTRNINAHIDYKTRYSGGPYLQQLFLLPGNPSGIYHPVRGMGSITLTDGTTHQVRIEVKDAFGNSSVLSVLIKFNVIPLSSGQAFPGKMFYPGMVDGYESANCSFYLGEKSLYDSVHIPLSQKPGTLPGGLSPQFSIGYVYLPLADNMLVQIKSDKKLTSPPFNPIVMVRTAGAKKEVQPVVWKNGWASAAFNEFGSFQLVTDHSPPQIRFAGYRENMSLRKAKKIVILVKDNLDAVRNFRAELDGNWLCFANDKGKAFVYTFDAHCARGKHILKIHAEDVAGNPADATFSFVR